MDRSFRLRDEDRADYAAVLDEVIGSAEIQRLLARSRIGAGQLRVKGLAAGPRVASAAEAEYLSYLALRRRTHDGGQPGGAASLSGPGHQERTGAGLVPVLAVLTPVLAAVAAATFLGLGYVLRLTDSWTVMAATLIDAGWISLGTAALAAVIGVVALYRTAAEHRASGTDVRAEHSEDLDRAREAWHDALRDAGIRPFLVARLREEPVEAEPGRSGAPDHRPRFSSPDFGRPAFGSPDFDSPDFAGPGSTGGSGSGGPDFGRPDYSGPGFASPGFDGPGSTGGSGSGGPDFGRPDYSGPDFSGPGLPDLRG
ncbi:hypothetical protein [Streptomyces sp. NPDC014734]|uniref:hypothetical protein n=1 Tax=Streptomyces sp. NPDC014734 TaxID=3364886 RepID=UPI0036F96897